MPEDISALFTVSVYVEAMLGLLLLYTWVQRPEIKAVAWWGGAHLLRAGSIALRRTGRPRARCCRASSTDAEATDLIGHRRCFREPARHRRPASGYGRAASLHSSARIRHFAGVSNVRGRTAAWPLAARAQQPTARGTSQKSKERTTASTPQAQPLCRQLVRTAGEKW
jgi:hypothetical protein